MSFLGSSPITSILGYVVVIMTVVQQVVTEQGLPHDVAGWLKLVGGIITGVALRFAKDANVSNAPSPTTVAQPVK